MVLERLGGEEGRDADSTNHRLFVGSKYESRLRVVRVAVDGGERVVGVRYPEMLIPEVEKTLKDQMVVERMQRVQAVSKRRVPSFLLLLLLVTGLKTPSWLLTYSCSGIPPHPPHPFSFSLELISLFSLIYFYFGGFNSLSSLFCLCIPYFSLSIFGLFFFVSR